MWPYVLATQPAPHHVIDIPVLSEPEGFAKPRRTMISTFSPLTPLDEDSRSPRPCRRKDIMYRKFGLFLSVVVGILVALYQSPATEPRQYVSGKNNTVLFIVNEHPGYCNVHIATAQSLLEKHPEISVEFASFPKISKSVARVSSFATKQSRASDIVFHALPGEAYMETILNHEEFRPMRTEELVLSPSPVWKVSRALVSTCR